MIYGLLGVHRWTFLVDLGVHATAAMELQSTRYPTSAGATLGGCSRTFIFFFQILSRIDTFRPRALPRDLGPFRSRSGRPSGTFIFSFGLGLVRWLWEPSRRIREGRQNDDLRSANPRSNSLICRLRALGSESDTPGVIRRSVGCLGCAMDPRSTKDLRWNPLICFATCSFCSFLLRSHSPGVIR